MFSLTPGDTVAIEEEDSAINVVSRGTTLMCTPILSCDVMNVSITWDVPSNESGLNNSSLPVEARQYGEYMCTVVARAIGMHMELLYELYGKTSYI